MLTKRSLKQQKQHDVLHKIMWRTVLKFLSKIYSTKLSRYFVLFNYKKLICSELMLLLLIWAMWSLGLMPSIFNLGFCKSLLYLEQSRVAAVVILFFYHCWKPIRSETTVGRVRGFNSVNPMMIFVRQTNAKYRVTRHTMYVALQDLLLKRACLKFKNRQTLEHEHVF